MTLNNNFFLLGICVPIGRVKQPETFLKYVQDLAYCRFVSWLASFSLTQSFVANKKRRSVHCFSPMFRVPSIYIMHSTPREGREAYIFRAICASGMGHKGLCPILSWWGPTGRGGRDTPRISARPRSLHRNTQQIDSP